MVKEEVSINSMIHRRIDELGAAAVALAKMAQKRSIIATIMKITIVVLGAFVTFKDATGVVFGSFNSAIHLVASILITVLAAVETALQFERRSERLNILANTCRNIKRKADSDIVKIQNTTAPDKKNAAELEMLDSLDQHFQDIQNQAASLKINTVLFVRSPHSQRSKPFK